MGWSAQYFTSIIIEGNTPSTGIFIYSPAPGSGNLIGSWTTQAGTDQFGNNFPAGIFAKAGLLSGVTLNALCSIAGSSITGSALTGCNYNGGTIKETVITFDSTAGSLFGYATTTSTTTITSSGNYTTPATSVQLTVTGFGGGAGGIYGGNFGGGGGGGEWSRDFFTYAPSTVIPVVIGSAGTGGTSSIFATSGGNTTWNGTDLIAHGGSKGNHGSGGNGGTGSTNTLHNDGGRGGNSTSSSGCGGGGGGASGSSFGTGNQGHDNAGSGTAAGGAALGGGGAGGQGGSGSNGLGTGAINGSVGTAPGGGGGGGGNNVVGVSANGAAGTIGQVVVSFSTSQALVLSVSPISGTDPLTSTAFPAGFMGAGLALADQSSSPAQVSGFSTHWTDSSGYPKYLSGDTSDTTAYAIGESVQFNTSAQTITSTTPVVVTGLSVPVGIGSYYFNGIIRLKQGATNVVQSIGLSGPAVSFNVWFQHTSQQAGTNGITFVQGSLSTVSVAFVAANDEDYWYFEGMATFSAAGTFSVVAAEGTALDTFTVQPGSIFRVRPVR